MKTLLAAAALTALAALALPAAAQEAPRQCFMQSQMGASVIPDDSTINVKVSSDTWQIKMAGACGGLRLSRYGYVLTLHSGATTICGPLDLDISVGDPLTPNKCLVDSVRKLTVAEVAALPPRDKP